MNWKKEKQRKTGKKNRHAYEKETIIQEDKKGKKLREKEEAEKLASQFEDQLTINLNDKMKRG